MYPAFLHAPVHILLSVLSIQLAFSTYVLFSIDWHPLPFCLANRTLCNYLLVCWLRINSAFDKRKFAVPILAMLRRPLSCDKKMFYDFFSYPALYLVVSCLFFKLRQSSVRVNGLVWFRRCQNRSRGVGVSSNESANDSHGLSPLRHLWSWCFIKSLK